ncbi:Ribosomal L18p/L5e family protein [Euphorbia peplus]|nr:Ribosomal L18p/L5e family protein [Euphorbia peplus]
MNKESVDSIAENKLHVRRVVRMTVLKRYILRMFISLKYITVNVVDRNNGRIVATASTVEHSIKNTLECGRTCNAKAAAVVGEVLAMRLKVEGLEQGQGRGIHVDVNKEVEKKGFKNRTKIWAIVNGLKNNGVKNHFPKSKRNDGHSSRLSIVTIFHLVTKMLQIKKTGRRNSKIL